MTKKKIGPSGDALMWLLIANVAGVTRKQNQVENFIPVPQIC